MSLRVAMMVALLLTLLVAVEPARSATATFTVNSTGDAVDANPSDGTCQTATTGECTLRAAIQEANATSGEDIINFNIPSGCNATIGVCTITLNGELGDLPSITDQVTINGYSQTGASPATDTSNADLKIELDESNVSDGIKIQAANCTIRGLIINRFSNRSVWLQAPGATGNKIEGNYIGTDASGTADLGNFLGVIINGGSNNTVGGTEAAARNVISGNIPSPPEFDLDGDGVVIGGILGGEATGNKVMRNYIGPDASGQPLGNTGNGVVIRGFSSTNNPILSNSINGNGDLGIDLVGGDETIFGVTRNDNKDPDPGANRRQNFPVLSSAMLSGGEITLTGLLNSLPRRAFAIQFFSSPAADASGFGEGNAFVGQIRVKTNSEGKRSFSKTFSLLQPVSSGEKITATATRLVPDPGNPTTLLPTDTSEFSAARQVN